MPKFFPLYKNAFVSEHSNFKQKFKTNQNEIEMVNAVAPEPQKSLESAQLTPAEAKRVKRIEDLVQPWKQKLTDHHIYDVSFHVNRS